MITTPGNLARVLSDGDAAYTITTPHDGISAVTVDPAGMVRSLLPIEPGYHDFALSAELGGRAVNLLHPWTSRPTCCIHGLVHRHLAVGADLSSTCDCGQNPIRPNPPRAS